jgi:hypothetical protein
MPLEPDPTKCTSGSATLVLKMSPTLKYDAKSGIFYAMWRSQSNFVRLRLELVKYFVSGSSLSKFSAPAKYLRKKIFKSTANFSMKNWGFL